MKILGLVLLLFFIYLLCEAAVIWYRAHRASSPVIKPKGREIKYDKAFR